MARPSYKQDNSKIKKKMLGNNNQNSKEENMGNNNKDIKKIIQELKKNKEVVAIYLFGSCAKGIATPISDIDICAVAKEKIPRTMKERILSNSSDIIDISLFWDLPIMIRFKVLKEGKLVYCKNNSYLHDIIIRTMHEYLDFKPVIDKFVNAYLA